MLTHRSFSVSDPLWQTEYYVTKVHPPAYNGCEVNPSDDEHRAITACLAGDREAFAPLVERHREAVFHLACRMCGDHATAEDLAQEAFLKAYTRLDRFDPAAGSFRNWVLGICTNLTRTHFRWRRRAQARAERAAEHERMRIEDGQARAAEAPDPERIRQALETLPPGLRVAVVLKYMENLSVQEIAETLGIGESAVKMRLARGREQLLARLGPERQVPEDEKDAEHH